MPRVPMQAVRRQRDTAIRRDASGLRVVASGRHAAGRAAPLGAATCRRAPGREYPSAARTGNAAERSLNRGDGSVTRVDPSTNKVVATIAVDPAAASGEIAAGAGSIWISAPGLPVIRIDPRTNRTVQKFTGEGGGAILVAHGSLWVAAGPKVTWRLDPVLVAGMRP